MRLVTFQGADGLPRSGAFFNNDQQVLDLRQASQLVRGGDGLGLLNVQTLLEGGDEALAEARALLARSPAEAVRERSEVKLLAPIQPPIQMRDCSCFELHLRQAFAASRKGRALRTPDPEATLAAMNTRADDRVIDTFNRQPIYYKCNRFATIGMDDDVIWPSYSKLLDFELEFGCYISKPAKDVPREKARDYIFGYTIFNDFSARDAQSSEMGGMLGPAKGKDFDTANVMGPCLVTADELPDPYNLTMIARVNGEEWGRGNSSDMRWQFEDLIAHISRSETLHAGEFLGSGTVGNGCGLEQLRYLKANDVVELEVEGIGILRSRIIRPALATVPV